MMINEFIEMTGIYPTSNLYVAIENSYYDFDGTKREFCDAYKANTNGIAEKIRAEADKAAMDMLGEHIAAVARLNNRIDELERKLEREQEWKPYVDTDNYQQSDYDRLRKAGRIMTDDEAKDLLYNEFGFAREKTLIYRNIPSYEVNRHHSLRQVGTIERLPLYDATDWNYIRFNSGCMSYELINGELHPFVH